MDVQEIGLLTAGKRTCKKTIWTSRRAAAREHAVNLAMRELAGRGNPCRPDCNERDKRNVVHPVFLCASGPEERVRGLAGDMWHRCHHAMWVRSPACGRRMWSSGKAKSRERLSCSVVRVGFVSSAPNPRLVAAGRDGQWAYLLQNLHERPVFLGHTALQCISREAKAPLPRNIRCRNGSLPQKLTLGFLAR